jgi:hypothetical protein
MGRHKKIEEIELIKDEVIPEKRSPSKLSGHYLGSFTGDSYEHAVRSAREWESRVNALSSLTYRVEIQDHFHQEAFGGRAIIVSYNRVEK